MMKNTISAALLMALTFGCTEQERLVTSIAYSYATDPECLPLTDARAKAIDYAITMWAEFGVSIVPADQAEAGAHPVSICYVERVPYDGETGCPTCRAAGMVDREASGSIIFMEAERHVVDLAITMTHEFGHIVTWSADHSDGPGMFFRAGSGTPEWSDADVAYFESLGLTYVPR